MSSRVSWFRSSTWNTAVVPPKVTEVVPPNPLPVIVVTVPPCEAPRFGLMLEIFGASALATRATRMSATSIGAPRMIVFAVTRFPSLPQALRDGSGEAGIVLRAESTTVG